MQLRGRKEKAIELERALEINVIRFVLALLVREPRRFESCMRIAKAEACGAGGGEMRGFRGSRRRGPRCFVHSVGGWT